MSMCQQRPFFGHHVYPLRYMSQDVTLLLGTEHQVNTIEGSHLLGLQLRVASRHDHQCTGMPAYHAAYGLTAFGIGHFRHAARVHYTYICRLAFCGGCHTSLLELATHGARLGEIEFAPQGKVGGFLA